MPPLTHEFPRPRRFKVGCVGGGKGAFFAPYHRAAMRLCNQFDVVAGVFSSDAGNNHASGEALGVAAHRIYATVEEMVTREQARTDRIDVALVVTPNHLHFEACRRFLTAGIPVICEKPLVNDLDQARALVRLSQQNGTFLGVTYTYLGYPMVRDARARIASGAIGEVRFVYVEYLLEWLAGDRAKLGKGGIWRGNPDQAGKTGVLGDIGTHGFNLMEFLINRQCLELNADLFTLVPGFALDDTNVIKFRFERGVQGLLWASLAAPGHRNGLVFRVVGSTGTLEWHQEAPETLKLGRLDQADLIYRRGASDMMPEARSSVSLPAGNPEAYVEALSVLYADFASALAGEGDRAQCSPFPIPDGEQGFRGVALCDAGLASSALGTWVKFPELEVD